MMKKKLVILGIVAILVCVGLSGCNQQMSNSISPKKSKFVGTWHNSTTVNIDLFSDGTCKFQSINGT
jgi:ABC-type oligopeptide transport system substrate-binding subunit